MEKKKYNNKMAGGGKRVAYVGIDQGSSMTKVLLLSRKGEVLHLAMRRVRTFRNGRTIFQKGEGILRSVIEGIREVLTFAEGNAIIPGGVGLATQRSSFLFFDKKGNPLSPVISWRDSSCRNDLVKFLPMARKVKEITGLPLNPYYSALKVKKYLPKGRDDIFFGTIGTFLIYRMTGGKCFAVDPGNAQRTLLFDVGTLAFSPDLKKMFAIPKRVIFPRVMDSVDSYGDMRIGGSVVPIRSLLGDQQAAFLASSGWKTGWRLANLGTGGFMLHPVRGTVNTHSGLIHTLSHSVGGKASFLLEGTVNRLSDSLHYFVSLTGKKDALSRPPEGPLPVCVDGIGGTGAPLWEREFPAAICGIEPSSRRSELVWSALFGALSYFKEIADAMDKECGNAPALLVSGGLSEVPGSVEFLRDLCQVNAYRAPSGEMTGIGAALTANGSDPLSRRYLRKKDFISHRGMGVTDAQEYFARWVKLRKFAKENTSSL